ncbi:MAG: hypothetical protein V3V88_02990 [Dehalococcoidia bacterium]
MSKDRNIGEVIDSMLEHIPEEHCLRDGMARVMLNAQYCAPEDFQRLWVEAAEYMHSCFGEKPSEEWQWKVCEIFAAKKLERE